MYNTIFVCTYNCSEFLETGSGSVTDVDINEEIRDEIYRIELLHVLGIEEYDEISMNKSIHELYERVKDCKELTECMAKLAGRFMSEDLELGLMILFAYDYMYLSHTCICEWLNTGKITEENIRKLRNVIF